MMPVAESDFPARFTMLSSLGFRLVFQVVDADGQARFQILRRGLRGRRFRLTGNGADIVIEIRITRGSVWSAPDITLSLSDGGGRFGTISLSESPRTGSGSYSFALKWRGESWQLATADAGLGKSQWLLTRGAETAGLITAPPFRRRFELHLKNESGLLPAVCLCLATDRLQKFA